MRKVLPQKFFNSPAPLVARELLGKYLIVRRNGREKAFMITETEAYDGFRDKASHASRGKTPRNAPMFGTAGRFYVYLCYGMYWMLNVVTGEKWYPAAVLIRGERGITGPGRLTKMLGIDKRFNNKMADKKTGLWFEDRGARISLRQIEKTPRIGVSYAGEWAKKKWRFVIKKSPPPVRGRG